MSFAPAIIGQEKALGILGAMLTAGRLPSMLFAGPAGTGKRTVALLLAQTANCSAENPPCGTCQSCRTIGRLRHPDIRVIFPMPSQEDADKTAQALLEKSGEYTLDKNQPLPDARRFILIGIARWLRREMAKPPLLARHRFFIFLHANRMKAEAANALLKILEEPQKQTTFILATDAPNALLDTIRSRCHLVRFAPVRAKTLTDWLVESKKVTPEDAAIAAQVSGGSPGKALRFLQDPDQYLARPAVEFFSLAKVDERDVLSVVTALQRTPLDTVVATLLFLYRQALRTKHGLASNYSEAEPAIRRKAEQASGNYLRRVVKYLAGRLEDSRLSIDRRLFLYTLFSSLRKPGN